MANFNFTKIKKEYFTVTLPDNKTIQVGTPTKAVMDSLIALQTSVDIEDEAVVIDKLFEVMTRVLNNNKAHIKIDKDYLEEVLDVADILTFFTGYMDYITNISSANAKN